MLNDLRGDIVNEQAQDNHAGHDRASHVVVRQPQGMLDFVMSSKRWWLLPMLIVIVAIFAFAFYVKNGEPIIYTRF